MLPKDKTGTSVLKNKTKNTKLQMRNNSSWLKVTALVSFTDMWMTPVLKSKPKKKNVLNEAVSLQ